MKFESDAGVEGLTLEYLEIPSGEAEAYIRDIIVHVGESGRPGD
jgi:hypothetical protein